MHLLTDRALVYEKYVDAEEPFPRRLHVEVTPVCPENAGATRARVLKLTQQFYGRKPEQQSPKDKDSVGDSSQQSQSSGRAGA